MNLYFLVEGKRTEARVYPRWLAHLLPHFARVGQFDEVQHNNYFLFSGGGYPSLLDVHLPHAIADYNKIALYTFLVVCLDADERSVDERVREVECRVSGGVLLRHGQLKVIVQNRTIETWFLGNPRILTRAPQSPRLRQYINFYDVSQHDPEGMGVYSGFTNHAQFHGSYLAEAFREKGIIYTKRCPGHVADPEYLEQLLHRVERNGSHMRSFQSFVQFCHYVRGATLHS